MPEPYAQTRVDALRNFRREGYAVVDREDFDRLRFDTTGVAAWRGVAEQLAARLYVLGEKSPALTNYERTQASTGTEENERLRSVLAACRDWFDNPDGEPSSSDLLDRINEVLSSPAHIGEVHDAETAPVGPESG